MIYFLSIRLSLKNGQYNPDWAALDKFEHIKR